MLVVSCLQQRFQVLHGGVKLEPLVVDALLDIPDASSFYPGLDRVDSLLLGSEEVDDLILSVVFAVFGRLWVGSGRWTSEDGFL